MTYEPMMSETEAKRRLEWQNRAYEEHRKDRKRKSFDILGRSFLVSPNVFVPVPWNCNLLAKTVLMEVRESDKVLDMSTGCGVQAILAASKSSNVIAVDVNPFAVRCARQNAKLNKVTSRVKVRESDLFENVKGRFDLIIFDPPFRWSKPRDIWERSSADEEYGTMNQFFKQAPERLNHGGRVLIHFGTSGDLTYLKYLIKKNGFRRRQVLKDERKGWKYFTYRLTR